MNLNSNVAGRQYQGLTFQMIQSLKVLQAGTQQLEQMLRAEVELNPVLEIEGELGLELDDSLDLDDDDRSDDGSANDDTTDAKDNGEDEYLEELSGGEDNIDWEEYLEDGFDMGGSYNDDVSQSEERYEPSPVYQETLEEHLAAQLPEKKIDERIRLLVEFIIGNLDDDGYLRLTITDISLYTMATVCEVEEALNVLQRLDPAGVGARDLRECMILQLRARKMSESVEMAIVCDYWALFEKRNIPALAKQLGVSQREAQEAVDYIKTLDPQPGHQYNAQKSAAIIPDLIVEKVEDRFIVMLNDRTIPTLYINKSYATMVRRGSGARKDVKEYVREKLNSAARFIQAIEQRRTTMLRVMYAIIERQKIFFEKGPPNITPLKMQEVADMIDMHVSTISRVANNKYVQTPHGIFELRYFFSEAVRRNEDGDESGGTDAGPGTDVTAERVKDMIRRLIDDEDPKTPITDQKIAEVLEKENLPVARRTVAKYREQMKIPTARMRQKYE